MNEWFIDSQWERKNKNITYRYSFLFGIANGPGVLIKGQRQGVEGNGGIHSTLLSQRWKLVACISESVLKQTQNKFIYINPWKCDEKKSGNWNIPHEDQWLVILRHLLHRHGQQEYLEIKWQSTERSTGSKYL